MKTFVVKKNKVIVRERFGKDKIMNKWSVKKTTGFEENCTKKIQGCRETSRDLYKGDDDIGSRRIR